MEMLLSRQHRLQLTLSTQNMNEKSANGSQYNVSEILHFQELWFQKSHDYPNSCVKRYSHLQRRKTKDHRKDHSPKLVQEMMILETTSATPGANALC